MPLLPFFGSKKKPQRQSEVEQYERPQQPSTQPSGSQREEEIGEEEQRRRADASIESVRRVRELMREKYRYDIFVWSKRDEPEANREYIQPYCQHADKTLREINRIVDRWDEDLFPSDEEWEVVRQIKAGLAQRKNDLTWTARPPWTR